MNSGSPISQKPSVPPSGGAPRLSVVIPVRNRAGTRADNCIRSLRWQTLPANQVEIILSDFGSDAHNAASLREIARSHGATLVFTKTDELWNRSRALNIGIQSAAAPYILCTDIDMLFRPNFLETALSRLVESDGKALVVCRCHDLPESVPEQSWAAVDYGALEAEATYRESHGTGACQAAPRSFFDRLRGYDEAYVFWGFEDGDMVSRANKAGLSLSWIHEQTSMLHQWHRPGANDKRHWKYINKMRFWLTRHRIVKNPKRWGLR